MFTDDVLVVAPGPVTTSGDVGMQYRVSDFSGMGGHGPSSEWQGFEAVKGEAQWCFTLPRGRMSVEVRAVSKVSGGVSEPSVAKRIVVRGGW